MPARQGIRKAKGKHKIKLLTDEMWGHDQPMEQREISRLNIELDWRVYEGGNGK